jgi:hypothetical protein
MTYVFIAAAYGLGILTPKTYAKLKASVMEQLERRFK